MTVAATVVVVTTVGAPQNHRPPTAMVICHSRSSNHDGFVESVHLNQERSISSSGKWGTCYFSVLAPGPTIFKLPPKASSTG